MEKKKPWNDFVGVNQCRLENNIGYAPRETNAGDGWNTRKRPVSDVQNLILVKPDFVETRQGDKKPSGHIHHCVIVKPNLCCGCWDTRIYCNICDPDA